MSLTLLHPDLLPRTVAELSALRSGTGHRLLAQQLAEGRPGTAILAHLRLLPPSPNGIPLCHPAPAYHSPDDISYDYDRRLADYDTFFDVIRVANPSPGGRTVDIFPHTMFVAYRSLLEEGTATGTHLSWAEWTKLCGAFHTMLGLVCGVVLSRGVSVPEPRQLRWHLDPDRRWRVGHQVFFALTQSLIVALGCLRSASDRRRAAWALALITRLLGAVAAAFVFTAEFSPSQYTRQVRPSMEPPSAPVGFSGLLSADHQYLIKLLSAMRPDLRRLATDLPSEHRAFTRAFAGMYESHKYVCRRFNGEKVSSLRMSSTSALTAVEVINGLKLARSKVLCES